MQICIDDRERKVIPYIEAFCSEDITYEVKRMEVGDYALVYRGHIMMLIERKTWADLASSIRDGRKNNIQKLENVRETTGCQVAYLIEGNPCPNFNKRFSRMPLKCLRAHLDHIAFRDGIHMIYSTDYEYTSKRLFELAHNFTTIKPSMLKPIDELITGGKDKPDVAKLTQKQNISVSTQEQLLMCLPSIGSTVSTVLAEAKVSLMSLYSDEHTAEELARLKYPTGNAIGLARAKRIYQNRMHFTSKGKVSKKYQVRLLSTVRGISKKTAEEMLKVIEFHHILDGMVNTELLKDLKRGKGKLGKKAAENILTSLLNIDLDTLHKRESGDSSNNESVC